MSGNIKLRDSDIHPHLKARMLQRGISKDEIEETLEKGKDARDAKPGTYGKVLAFSYDNSWEGKFYKQKEVAVYYKLVGGTVMVLTVKARYGERFEEMKNENRI
ncbi:MAG: DUF4258 domain-containing protein [Chloroflexota bacterium]